MRFASAVALITVLLFGRASARAETCPDIPADESGLRRSMAKEWFAKAEESETSGDKPGAVRRYACSLNLTPHPSTAYNLGTVAEKSGDWSMAIEGFRAYLTLSPEAPDRPTIEARVAALEVKLAELRKDLAAKGTPAKGAVLPNAAASATAPPVGIVPPPPPPAPVVAEERHGHRVAGWVTLASAATTAGAGLALNLMARSKVNECYRLWNTTQAGSALDKCDAARPYAYGSYALFGVAGALAATGAALMFWPSSDAHAAAPSGPTEISFAPLAGGATAFVSGRF